MRRRAEGNAAEAANGDANSRRRRGNQVEGAQADAGGGGDAGRNRRGTRRQQVTI